MKKFIVFAVVLGLLVPAAAFAKADFSLGGFIKLDSFWDSGQTHKNMIAGYARDNVGLPNHGKMQFTSQGSRFNFTIKGPKLWGATTTGYLEMDFDRDGNVDRGVASSYAPRLRHAMFRFNWPETELLFGQYWSMLAEWYPELAEDGPFMNTGAPTARLAQIRFTQKFLGWGTAALLIGDPNAVDLGQAYTAVSNSGQSAATPQVQGKLQYQQDLWGKAAYYGRPIPFTASIVAAYQRSHFAQDQAAAIKTWNNNCYGNALNVANVSQMLANHQTLDPWIVKGSFFIPVIPTHSANLAGTASILTTWYVGEGVEAFGFAGVGNLYEFNKRVGANYLYDYQLQKRWGGFAQAQYYFNNQWFLTAAYGISANFGANLYSRDATARVAGVGNNEMGFKYAVANGADLINVYQQAEVCLWYRPIQAFKFGLEYAYGAQNWFQTTSAGQAAAPLNYVVNPVNTSRDGNRHRVEFVGFFYF